MSGSLKRFSDGSGRIEAPSPSAPTRDMTIAELTRAYQHLAAQAAVDKAWAKMVEGAIADYVLRLDRHISAGDAVMYQVEMRLKRQFDAIPTAATAQTVDTTDVALRAHVQA